MIPIKTRTPKAITPHLTQLCARVASHSVPVSVPVAAVEGGIVHECFENVRIHAEKNGGEIVFGWSIAEWPGVFAEAQFHAVWKAPDGELRCLTPNLEGESTILFLPDPVRIYEGLQVDNVRMALSENHYVKEFISEAERLHRVMNRGERAFRRDLAVPRDEVFPIVKKMHDLMKRMERLAKG
jgi:hypothetical protein